MRNRFIGFILALALVLSLATFSPSHAAVPNAATGPVHTVTYSAAASGCTAQTKSSTVRRERVGKIPGTVKINLSVRGALCDNWWRADRVNISAKRSRALCGKVRRLTIDPDIIADDNLKPVSIGCVGSGDTFRATWRLPNVASSRVYFGASDFRKCLGARVFFDRIKNYETYTAAQVCVL